MSATVALLKSTGLLLGLGFKYVRSLDADDGLVKKITDDFSSLTTNLISGPIGERLFGRRGLDLADLGNEHLVRFTGVVLRCLTEEALEDLKSPQASRDLRPTLRHLPDLWARFVSLGTDHNKPLAGDDFLGAIHAGLSSDNEDAALTPGTLTVFYAWFMREVRLPHLVADFVAPELEQAIAPLLADALTSAVVSDDRRSSRLSQDPAPLSESRLRA